MATVSISIDDTLKQQAEMICADLGINLSIATIMFLKQLVNHNGIPFELRADPFYSAENQARLLIAKERMEQCGGTIHDLVEVNDD